jgi:hypothetical protein
VTNRELELLQDEAIQVGAELGAVHVLAGQVWHSVELAGPVVAVGGAEEPARVVVSVAGTVDGKTEAGLAVGRFAAVVEQLEFVGVMMLAAVAKVGGIVAVMVGVATIAAAVAGVELE